MRRRKAARLGTATPRSRAPMADQTASARRAAARRRHALAAGGTCEERWADERAQEIDFARGSQGTTKECAARGNAGEGFACRASAAESQDRVFSRTSHGSASSRSPSVGGCVFTVAALAGMAADWGSGATREAGHSSRNARKPSTTAKMTGPPECSCRKAAAHGGMSVQVV